MALLLPASGHFPRPNPLSSEERDHWRAETAVASDLPIRLLVPCFGHALRHPKSRLPFRERARVRALCDVKRQMRQNQLEFAEARLLRQNLTPPELAMWCALRDRRFLGLKFRSQATTGPCIADFLCVERRLILEVDALSPPPTAAWLAAQGYWLIHLPPQDLLTNLPGCLQHLAEELAQ